MKNYLQNTNKLNIFDERYKEILYVNLSLLGEGPPAWYKDALKLFKDDCRLENKAHFIAHSFREIDSSLLQSMPNNDFAVTCYYCDDSSPDDIEIDGNKNVCKKCGEKVSGRKSKILHIVKIWNIDENLEKDWIKSTYHKYAHRNNLGKPRKIEEEDFLRFSMVYSALLKKLEEGFPIFVGRYRKFIKENSIDRAAKLIEKNIPKVWQLQKEIFSDESIDSKWLSQLNQSGFFNNPPLPIEHIEGGVSFPDWPQLTYLEKVSKESNKQQEIQEIFSSIETENIRVQTRIAEISSNFSNMSDELITRVKNFVKNRKFWLLPNNFAEFISTLLNQGREEEALEILNIMLGFAEDRGPAFSLNNPKSKFSDYDYAEVLSIVSLGVSDESMLIFIRFLMKKLNEGLKIKLNKDEAVKDDLSYIWHKSIEGNKESSGESALSSLINTLLSFFEKYAEKEEDLEELIEILNKETSTIYRRIKLHIIRKYAPVDNKMISGEIISKDNFHDVGLHHEYYVLCQERGSEISEDDKKLVRELLDIKPDKEKFEKNYSKDGNKPSSDDYERYVLHYKIRKLSIFNNVDSTFDKEYRELVKDVDEPKHPGYTSYSESGSWGYKSPFSLEDLKKKSHCELVEAISSWKPESGNYRESDEGIANQLTKLVEDDLKGFVDELDLYKKVKVRFQQAILNGVRNKVKNSTLVNWDSILNFCDDVSDSCISNTDDENSNWCLKTILDLIQDGFRFKNINVRYKERIWNLIKKMSWHENPTRKTEENYLKNSEAFNLAINSVRGEMIHTAINYGLWLKKEDSEVELNELFNLLDEHLNREKELSLAVHSAFGQFLPILYYLNKDWLLLHVENIFPKDIGQKKYRRVAWRAYILLSGIYQQLFHIIKDEYDFAINKLTERETDETQLGTIKGNLANHLGIFYWQGVLSLDSSLIKSFFDEGSSSDKKNFVNSLGGGLKKMPKISEEVMSRLVDFWNWRKKLYEKGLPQDYADEIQAYGSWFVSGKLDDDMAFEILNFVIDMVGFVENGYKVMEQLLVLYSGHPIKSLKLAGKIIRGVKHEWHVHRWLDDLDTMIENSRSSEDIKEVQIANSLAGILFTKGYSQFSR